MINQHCIDKSGAELEQCGKEKLQKLGLTCYISGKQVPLTSLNPSGSHAVGENVEFDYVIPYGEYCIVGEITSRKSPTDLRDKYKKFKTSLDHVRNNININTWLLLNIPDTELHNFRDVKYVMGMFISTNLEKFDVNLPSVERIVIYYKSDWLTLEDYVEAIGLYANPYFWSKFGVSQEDEQEALMIKAKALVRSNHRKITSGIPIEATLYTFEISPYKLLGLVEVFRRDGLPSLKNRMNYQRSLDSSKLREIRKKALVEPDFMFPNAILLVMSSDCRYSSSEDELIIPRRYGSLAIIDGQHRLFSYATKDITNSVRNNARILVTAIQFDNKDNTEIERFSARTFVEINTKQARVKTGHLDAISYNILGETNTRALAAEVILRVNEGNSKLRGIFETSRTGLGVISSITVLDALKPITNIKRVRELQNAKRGKPVLIRTGYINLVHPIFEELTEAENLVKYTSVCLARYSNYLEKVFRPDWPVRNTTNTSALAYAKFFSAFIKLLWQFIREGADWECVEAELKKIRTNVLKLTDTVNYNSVLFLPDHPDLPGSEISANTDFHFLMENRKKPTSVTNIQVRKSR